MVVNQSQVDQILSAASEDDPEVKLQNLEREVDLIKTSIKRLLIDIRERMNDIDNPFTTSGLQSQGNSNVPNTAHDDVVDAHASALEAREAALDAREQSLRSSEEKGKEKEKERQSKRVEDEDEEDEGALSPVDRQILDALKAQLAGQTVPSTVPAAPLPSGFASPGLAAPIPGAEPVPLSEPRSPNRMQLQKAYRLFKWTNRAVKKYGHDRLETMLQSYRSMGYISMESCDEVTEIARLMPTVLGDVHEIDPGEYVAELYVLNRILSPNDLTLDRDMIEVLMEQRQQRSDIGEDSSRDTQRNDEWINLLDRI
jgi:hypothetical protein